MFIVFCYNEDIIDLKFKTEYSFSKRIHLYLWIWSFKSLFKSCSNESFYWTDLVFSFQMYFFMLIGNWEFEPIFQIFHSFAD